MKKKSKKKAPIEASATIPFNEVVCYHENQILRAAGLPPCFVTDGMFVKPKNEPVKVKLKYEDIKWIEAENSYSHFHMKNQKIVTVANNIGSIERQLPIRIFARVNRSEIINLHLVEKINGNSLKTDNHLSTVTKQYCEYIASCFNEI